MALFFGGCRRGTGTDANFPAGVLKGRRLNSDWPVVWSPRSSLSDESGIEVDESPGAAAHSRQHVTRAQAVATWLAQQAVEEAGLESELKQQQRTGSLPLYSSRLNPLHWPEVGDLDTSQTSFAGMEQHRAYGGSGAGTSDYGSNGQARPSVIVGGDVSLGDASLYSSLPSLLEVQPAPILPQERHATVEMNGTSLRKGDIPHYNYSVLQNFCGSSGDLTKNTIDVLAGELVSLIHVDNGWAYVITMDHYCGYVPASYLSRSNPAIPAPQATKEEVSHAQSRLGTLDSSTARLAEASSVRSREGPATQLKRMHATSPSHSNVSSSTLTVAENRPNDTSDSASPADLGSSNSFSDGFWSADHPNVHSGRTPKASRRRTRIPEWRTLPDSPVTSTPTSLAPLPCRTTASHENIRGSASPVLPYPAGRRHASSPTLLAPHQRHPASPAASCHTDGQQLCAHSSKSLPGAASNQRSARSSSSLPCAASMQQLETPPPTESSWYSSGISPLTPAEPFTRCRGQDVVCLYDFTAGDENDLSVVSGEGLTILNQSDPDWLWVSNGKSQQGFVPASYVCHIAEDRCTTSPPDGTTPQRNQASKFYSSRLGSNQSVENAPCQPALTVPVVGNQDEGYLV